MGCIKPISIKNPAGFGTLRVPCGNCPGCKNKRAADWAFRLQQESKRHASSHFATLTYDDEHVQGSPNGLLTLNKIHLQTFFKTLRKQSPGEKIKYYACGEYGGRTFRPHYHAIIFGATPSAVDNSWNHGHVRIDPVNDATIRYVTGYVTKPSVVDKSDPNDDRQRESAFMSKNMGLNYLTDEIKDYHEKGSKSFLTLPGGQKQALPRYYRDKIFTEYHREEMNEILYNKSEQKRRLDIEAAGSVQVYEENRRAGIAAAMEKYNSQRYSKRNQI